MACTECSMGKCPRGAEYYAKVKAVAVQFKANPAGITLAALFSTTGIDRNRWYPDHNGYNGVKNCVELYLGLRIVAEIHPSLSKPKRQLLELISREEEERTRNTSHR